MLQLQDLQKVITEALQKHINPDISLQEVIIQYTNPEHSGDFTVLLQPFLKKKYGSPHVLADAITKHLYEQTTWLQSHQLVGGFLNLTLREETWIEFLQAYERQIPLYPPPFQKLLVEFSSPNTNKPLHLGHLRNIFLGDAICKIYAFLGASVFPVCLVNDRGIHICKSMLAWKLFGNNHTPQTTNTKGDHFVGDYYVLFEKHFQQEYADFQQTPTAEQLFLQAQQNKPDLSRKAFFDEFKDHYFNRYSELGKQAKELLQKWENNDPDTVHLWKTMNQWVYDGFKQTYQQLGIAFVKYYYESETYLIGKKLIMEGLERGIFFQKEDGSIWVDLTDKGLQQKSLLRSDGTSLYITQDLGTALLKQQDFDFDLSVYVIGNEQDYYMKTLMETCKKLQMPKADALFHLSYGMVELPTGKMKSREGTVVDADELILEMISNAEQITEELGKTEGLNEQEKQLLYQTLGIGALKYFLLKIDPHKKILFDPKESIDLTGNTAPFIQYTYARIHSLLKKAQQVNLPPTSLHDLTIAPHERELIRKLHRFSIVLFQAAKEFNPAILANYAYELAKSYATFYQNQRILEPMNAKLSLHLLLSQSTMDTLKIALQLLGISTVNKM